MSDDLARLRRRLCRELVQSELDAALHARREIARLGSGKPATALAEIAAHAEHLRPRLDALLVPGQRAGRLFAHTLSLLRQLWFDRLISTERSYRATLLALWQGLDAARLLREVAARSHDVRLHRFCDDLIAQREVLIRQAESALDWFATHPHTAMSTPLRAMGRQRSQLHG